MTQDFDWSQGNCTQESISPHEDPWYPTTRQGTGAMTAKDRREYNRQVAKGKVICSSCPIIGDCLEYSIATQNLWGTWGGLTETERRRLIAQRFPGFKTPPTRNSAAKRGK